MTAPLEQKLAALHRGRIRQISPRWIELAASSTRDYGEFLDPLRSKELLARQEHQLRPRRQAFLTRRPWRSLISRRAPPSNARCCAVIDRTKPLGQDPSGDCAGNHAAAGGSRVRSVVAQQLAHALLETTARRKGTQLIGPLTTCDRLIRDEFGYLPLDRQVGPALYEISAGRYQTGAPVITSTRSLAT